MILRLRMKKFGGEASELLVRKIHTWTKGSREVAGPKNAGDDLVEGAVLGLTTASACDRAWHAGWTSE